jgi:molybdopterin-guanine dinucleotide biosynthesis protein A
MAPAPAWTAVVLTGGGSTRLGRDKATVLIGEHTALAHVLVGIPADVPVVVVGPDPATVGRAVTVCREDPPGGGPAAGLQAALAHISTRVAGVLATDMPFAGPVLERLVRELPEGADGLLAVDATGRRQYLCAVYRTDVLRAVLSGDVHNQAMHHVLQPLTLVEQVIEDGDMLLDIDTPEDLHRAEERVRSGYGRLD